MTQQETDEKYMRRALQLAYRGSQTASPNPLVGAVVVCDDKIIGEGWHRKCGEAHAEVNAIASVSDEDKLKDSTIYVTLEPCSHFGKTPPCCDLIIARRIKRVVIGCEDPFALVQGRGIARIKASGAEVVTGILEQECREINRKFFTAQSCARPYVLLKWAESSDGFIGGYCNNKPTPRAISTPLTSMLVSALRGRYDAIMVGAGTVISDNPRLTTRKWSGKNPLRVIANAHGELPSGSRVFSDGSSTVLFADSRTDLPWNVEQEVKSGGFTIGEMLTLLRKRGIISLLVEGGARTLQQFIDSKCFDEIRIEISPEPLESGVKSPTLPHGIKLCEQTELDGATIRRYIRVKNI